MIVLNFAMFCLFSVSFIGRVQCGEYLGVNIYKDSGCSDLFFNYVIKTGVCGDETLNIQKMGLQTTKVVYGGNQFVKYDRFNDLECNELNSTMNISVNSCQETSVSYNGYDYYLNFTFFDSFPLEITQTKENPVWILRRYFTGESCVNPVVYHNVINNEPIDYYGSTSVTASNILDDFFFSAHCNEEFMIMYMKKLGNQTGLEYDDEHDLYLEVVYAPRSMENVCQYPTLEFWMDGMNSIPIYASYECHTQEYMSTEIISQFPKQSSHKYLLQYQSYFDDCHSFYQAYPWKLDQCYSVYTFGAQVKKMKYVANTKRNIWMLYEGNVDCECQLTSFVLANSTPTQDVYDNCTSFPKEDVLAGQSSSFCSMDFVPVYRYQILSDDPYMPNQIAFLLSDQFTSCSDDITSLLEQPYGGVLQYFDNEFCSSTSLKTVISPNFSNLGKSFRGYCDQGVMKVEVFNTTENCYGGYESLEISYENPKETDNPFCSEDISVDGVPISKRVLCIPRYCSGISELDADVCSGMGECTSEGCNCTWEGYNGENCELYGCYGISSRETSDVCSGRGACIEPNVCDCDRAYYVGEECDKDVLANFLIGFGVVGFVLLVFCGFLCCFAICSVCCCFISSVSFLCGIGFRQQLKLTKYGKLDDFDILYQEQLMEKDVTKAHLRINKRLFEIDFDEVNVTRMIGSGGSDSHVFLAEWKGNEVAFKCFKTKRIMSDQDHFNQFEAEVNLLINISHPNIIQVFGASLKPPRVGIVMEYCENGEILKFLVKYREERNAGYPMEEKIRVCREVISAIEYIHSRSIVHRDIKSENILLDSNERCKLMDFGISRIIENEEEKQNVTRRIGTNIYMAPEVMKGGDGYDEKVDSFSFSIFMWIIFSERENPYPDHTAANNIEFLVASDPNLRPPLEEEFLGEVATKEEYGWLVKSMERGWDEDPLKRYSFVELSDVFKNQRIKGEESKVEGDPENEVGESGEVSTN